MFEASSPQPIKLCTQELLQSIRHVIKHTATPTWVDTVPSNFGAAKAGTLKAAEWRNMATIFLPIALVKVWGTTSTHGLQEEADRLKAVLDHTMCLVCATILACSRVTSSEKARLYLDFLKKYLQDLIKLYPQAHFTVNCHVALHIYDFLLLFGPVHNWWTFPFERLIGILQRLPSNHKFGMLLFSCCES